MIGYVKFGEDIMDVLVLDQANLLWRLGDANAQSVLNLPKVLHLKPFVDLFFEDGCPRATKNQVVDVSEQKEWFIWVFADVQAWIGLRLYKPDVEERVCESFMPTSRTLF